MAIDFKGLVLKGLYGRWRGAAPTEAGYSILLPFPEDMPFLLQYALEGLKHLDLANCRQILVVGDGVGGDPPAFRALIRAADDPRIELVEPAAIDRMVVPKLRNVGSSLHWLAIVRGTAAARAESIFLHDSDSFFLEAEGLERQYREFAERGMLTLGVTARWDPIFRQAGFEMPGTWEMMYSTRWARSHSPMLHKGRLMPTRFGPHVFDTMLYPQFLDSGTGKVGVMANPPRFVHFNGTIVTYRVFREGRAGGVVDELFRLLLLAILADLIPSGDGARVVPTVAELARGLDDPSAPVTYGSQVATQEFPIFRRMIGELCEAPIMRGDRARRIEGLMRPFDDHFATRPADPTLGSLVGQRTAALG